MINKRFQLHISKPCNEDWNEMKPLACGRFCDSCRKRVVDFTKMNDEQVLLFFRDNTEIVCGRLRNDQLNKEVGILNSYMSWFRKILRLIIPVTLFSCNDYGMTMDEVIPVPENNQQGIDTGYRQKIPHDSVGIRIRPADSFKATGKTIL